MSMFSALTTTALAVDNAALSGYAASREMCDDPDQARANRQADIDRLLGKK